ncbi:PLP-dependent aminotransferase family protein [Intrasporangium calvum]|uniref:PLP-dependent aminotransferase family protein n=1 Tax=Intrasporangium calvum TaxID=53358 RepID=A0ABT5GGY3_9MICO|nr:PLP-dependent aminotransferase family protein [Intrasporangium calvum]MDC5697474.1 PLP-dependent aminotransferase family protein [Intrasporangium calvum]
MRDVLSALEERLDSPTSKGLAHAVSIAIRDGALAPGDRLPPIRRVAQELMLSPTTVSAAWQLLSRSGTIRSDGRRGTTVAPATRGGERYSTALKRDAAQGLDLSTGVPDPALLPDLAPLTDRLDGQIVPSSYLDDPVLPELRDLLLADWPAPAEDLLIVDGAMDALDLVTRTLIRPGDHVIVESPGFPVLLDLLEDRGVVVQPVHLDHSGPDLDDVAARLTGRPAAMIIQPRGQNPTGVSLTPTRARRLAGLLGSTSCLVIEDDSAGDIASSPALSLGAWLPDRTVHIRSFSKSYGPDLRLAAMTGPSHLLAPIRHLRALGQGWTSRLLQRALTALLTDPEAQARVRSARAEYARRRSLVTARLAAHGIAVEGTDGLNIWVPVRDESAAVLRLASAGIAVAPGGPFVVDSRVETPHIRVTTGLIASGHVDVADAIAEAATASAWSAQHR